MLSTPEPSIELVFSVIASVQRPGLDEAIALDLPMLLAGADPQDFLRAASLIKNLQLRNSLTVLGGIVQSSSEEVQDEMLSVLLSLAID
jgi:hypothetical protein